MKFPSKWESAVVAIAVTVCSSPALAQQSAEKAALAQALFDEGRRLMDAGQPAAACPKFAASQKLDPGMGTKFRLAECFEKIGKTASAWALFLEIGDEARGAKRPEREEIARKRAADLAPKLARMTVVVAPDSAGLAGLEIRRDGTVLDRAIWGVAAPVDPGEHVLTAIAPGKLAWESKSIVAQPSRTVEVTIPWLEDQPNEGFLKPVAGETAPVEKRSLVPAVILGSIGVVALGVGGALLGVGRRSEITSRSNRTWRLTPRTIHRRNLRIPPTWGSNFRTAPRSGQKGRRPHTARPDPRRQERVCLRLGQPRLALR